MKSANNRAPQHARTRPRHLYLVPSRRVTRASYVPTGRGLHLVDVENLMGGPFAGVEELDAALKQYRKAAGVRDGDHVYVASNPGLACDAGLAWPGSQVLRGHGPDGADLALLGVVEDTRWVAERFDRVIIGSGDGIFADAVSSLRSTGIAVGVVAVSGCVSRDLAGAATFLRLLPDPTGLKVVA